MKNFFMWLVILSWAVFPCASFAEPAIQAVNEPKKSITLKEAVAFALLQNPNLEAFSFEKRAKEAQALQSGLLPNPELNVFIEDGTGTGGFSGFNRFDQSQTTIQLSQLIELGGKRAARLHANNLSKKLAEWDYETQRMDVLTQVAKSFSLLLKAQQQKKLSEDLVQLGEKFLATVSERIKAGKVAALEKVKAELNLSSLKIELDKAKRELDIARSNLSITWGTAKPQFESAIGHLNLISEIPSLENLKTRLTQNPDLARWATELEQRQAKLDSEISKSIPDLNSRP